MTAVQDTRAIAQEYFTRVDTGGDFLSLFDDNACVYFPKHAPARGIKDVTQLFDDIGKLFSSVTHEIAYCNYVVQGEYVAAEGFTHGVLSDGTPWRATESLDGRFCNVFEICDAKIQRPHIYLDPDYGDADTARYPWLVAPSA